MSRSKGLETKRDASPLYQSCRTRGTQTIAVSEVDDRMKGKKQRRKGTKLSRPRACGARTASREEAATRKAQYESISINRDLYQALRRASGSKINLFNVIVEFLHAIIQWDSKDFDWINHIHSRSRETLESQGFAPLKKHVLSCITFHEFMATNWRALPIDFFGSCEKLARKR
jgi:hypothetical protein